MATVEPEPGPHETLTIQYKDLDNILHTLWENAGEDIDPPMYADAYQSGKEDGIRAFHQKVVEVGEIE